MRVNSLSTSRPHRGVAAVVDGLRDVMTQSLSDGRVAPRDDPKEEQKTEGIDLSIVVPAYDGARTIADCLASVEHATRGRRREIIVVESSGDATAEIIRRRFLDVVLIRSAERLSAGGARNRGAARARGRLVFFTDQDCIVPADWIDRLERHLQDRSVGAAGGAVGIANPANLSGCAVYFLEFLKHFPGNRPARRDDNFLVGCNSAFRAEVLDIVRFPDQTIGEDVLLSHALRSHNFGLVYDPRIEVQHHNREGWREFFNYNRKMGRSAASYHHVLRRGWATPFLRVPWLVFLAPVVVLPSIALDLARSRWSYFFRFLLVSPMCLLGNLVWANAFEEGCSQCGQNTRKPMTRNELIRLLRRVKSRLTTGGASRRMLVPFVRGLRVFAEPRSQGSRHPLANAAALGYGGASANHLRTPAGYWGTAGRPGASAVRRSAVTSIVIPVFNNAALTHRCLESIIKETGTGRTRSLSSTMGPTKRRGRCCPALPVSG